MDPTGTLIIVADAGNHAIRRISPGGVVTTLVGALDTQGSNDGAGHEARLSFPVGMAIDPAGRIFFTDAGNNTVRSAVPRAAPVAADSRLLNLSTRGLCLTGGDVLIPGFVVSGAANKRLLIRAVGPKLADFGVTGALANPQMTLKHFVGAAFVDYTSNDDWGSNTNAAEIVTTSAAIGAFDLNNGSADAALLLEVPPGN